MVRRDEAAREYVGGLAVRYDSEDGAVANSGRAAETGESGRHPWGCVLLLAHMRLAVVDNEQATGKRRVGDAVHRGRFLEQAKPVANWKHSAQLRVIAIFFIVWLHACAFVGLGIVRGDMRLARDEGSKYQVVHSQDKTGVNKEKRTLETENLEKMVVEGKKPGCRAEGVLCPRRVVPWTISQSITGGVISRRGRGGGDGTHGKRRFRIDGETTRERRAGEGSTFSVCDGSWVNGSRDEPRRGCAWSAAAMSSRVVEDTVFGGYDLLYLERRAQGGAEYHSRVTRPTKQSHNILQRPVHANGPGDTPLNNVPLATLRHAREQQHHAPEPYRLRNGVIPGVAARERKAIKADFIRDHPSYDPQAVNASSDARATCRCCQRIVVDSVATPVYHLTLTGEYIIKVRVVADGFLFTPNALKVQRMNNLNKLFKTAIQQMRCDLARTDKQSPLIVHCEIN
ncbi:hypothetical protein BJV78DRAFT_1353825 [Lactifluus subvellereus]|nr:hypothetical protein BJV78DRAFT_1353825 [Lactifluus subvellereus]